MLGGHQHRDLVQRAPSDSFATRRDRSTPKTVCLDHSISPFNKLLEADKEIFERRIAAAAKVISDRDGKLRTTALEGCSFIYKSEGPQLDACVTRTVAGQIQIRVWRPRNNWTTHCFAFLRRGSVHPG